MNLPNILHKENIDKVSSLLKEVYHCHVLLYSEAQKWKKLFKLKNEENEKLLMQIATLKSKMDLYKEKIIFGYTNNESMIYCPENNFSDLKNQVGQMDKITSTEYTPIIIENTLSSDEKNNTYSTFLNSNTNCDNSNIETIKNFAVSTNCSKKTNINNKSSKEALILLEQNFYLASNAKVASNPINSLANMATENFINESLENSFFLNNSDHESHDNNIYINASIPNKNNTAAKSIDIKIIDNILGNELTNSSTFEHELVDVPIISLTSTNTNKKQNSKLNKIKSINKNETSKILLEQEYMQLNNKLFECPITMNSEFSSVKHLVPQTQECEIEKLKDETFIGQVLIVPETVEVDGIMKYTDCYYNKDHQANINSLVKNELNNINLNYTNTQCNQNNFNTKIISTTSVCNNDLNPNNYENNSSTLSTSNDLQSKEIDFFFKSQNSKSKKKKVPTATLR